MSNSGNNTIHGKDPTGVAGQPGEVKHTRGTPASNADNAGRADEHAPHERDGHMVALTFAPKQLQAIRQTVRDVPDVDRARVEQLKTLIENGRYSVSFASTADKLLQTERLLD